MNKNSSFNSAVNSFIVICNTLYFYLGITAEEIRESQYFHSFFTAAYNLAYVMVYSPVYSDRIKALCNFTSEEPEDVVHNLTIKIVDKYKAITIAMSKKGDEMNLKGYSSALVSSSLNDWGKKYVDKSKTEYDTNGKEIKANYVINSLDSLLSSEDNAKFLIDILQSEESSPEDTVIAKDNETESINAVYEYMRLIAKHSNKGRLFACVMSCLEENKDPVVDNVYDYMEAMCKRRKSNFYKIYNNMLIRYADSIGMDRSMIKQFMASSLSEFGRNFSVDYYENFPGYISRNKYLVKLDLAKALDIDLGPKQVRRKTK